MLTSTVLTYVIKFINSMTVGLAKLTFSVSDGFYEILNNYLCCVMYFFPYKQLLPLAMFVFAMFVFRTVIAIIKTIWELLPIL